MSFVIRPGDGVSVGIDDTAAEPVRFAAEELKRYLNRVLGPESESTDKAAARLVLREQPAGELGEEGYAFDVEAPDTLVIRGGSGAAVVYGAYEFLRRYAGCRFSGLGPDAEHVPARQDVRVEDTPVRMTPRLWYRGLQFSSLSDLELMLQRIDWMAKNGFNYVMLHPYPDVPGAEVKETVDPATGQKILESAQNMFTYAWFEQHMLPELRKRGLKVDMNHHNLFYWLPPETYFDEHPEWYAEVDGERVAKRHQLSVCTSNGEAVDTLVANVKAFLRKHPEVGIIGVIPEDGIGMCECDTCRAMDDDPGDASKPYAGHRTPDGENPSKTNRYARLLNTVADAIGKEFPNVLVGSAAYVDLQWPPRRIALAPTIVPWVAIYWRCAAHPLTPDACRINRMFFDLLRQWRTAHKGRLILYEYYMGMNAQRALPYPMAEVICREWPGLKELGIQGATIQSRERDHNVYALNYLAFARHGWADAVDYETLLDDFLTGMFGAAAPAIKPVYERLQRKLQRVEREGPVSPYLQAPPPAVGCFLPNAENIAYILDPEQRRIMFACIDRAAETASTDRERRQVERFRHAAQYWDVAARIVELQYEVAAAEQAGEHRKAAELAAARLPELEKDLDAVEARPADGWIRDPGRWRRQALENIKQKAGLPTE